MKKRKRDALKLACVLLALALVASGAALYSIRRTYAPYRTEAVRDAMSAVENSLSFGGVKGVTDGGGAFMQGAAGWLGSEDGNLILFSRNGDVIASLNGNFLKGNTLALMTPRYFSGKSGTHDFDVESGPALILNGTGEILHRLHFLPDLTVSDAERASFGQDSPAYSTYFPALNEAMYAAYANYLEDGFVYDDWEMGEWEGEPAENTSAANSSAPGQAVNREEWMDIPSVRRAINLGATQADADAVKRYCTWERDQLERAGDWCAQLVTDETGDVYALAVYENNAKTNAAYNHTMNLWAWFYRLMPVWLFGLVLLVIMMAFWVLRDARKRDFKPALWGILTLLGNVASLIVYLIVRPAEARCPACGAHVQRDYVACPMCGSSLRGRCPVCGRAQEGAWVCCPYCGRKRDA